MPLLKVVHMDSFDIFTLNTFHQKTDKAVFSADGKYIFCCNRNYIEKFSSETYKRLYYVKKYQEPYHENTVDRTLNYFKEHIYQFGLCNRYYLQPRCHVSAVFA